MQTFDRNFIKQVFTISIPVILQQVINICVNLTDNVMLGSFGENQISGAALANQFYFLFQIFCLGLGGGTAVMVNQLWGKQDIPNIKRLFTLMLRVGIFTAILFMIITFLFPDLIMSIFSNDPEVIAAGTSYLKVVAFIYIFHGLTLTLTIVYRSVGVVRLALMASVISFGLNIFFNWIFIFGKLGAPRLEIAGAAIGTLIARVVECTIVIIYVFVIDKRVRYQISDIMLNCKPIIREFTRLSIPVIISDVILALGNNALSIIMGHIGKEMVSANSITMTTVQISTMFILGLSNAASVMVGNKIGQGDTKTAMGYGYNFLIISTVVGILASFIIRLLGPFIVSWYNITEATYQCTMELMDAICLIVIFQSISSVMTKGVLRGGGDTRFLMFADVLFLWIVSVPLGALSGLVWHMSSFWVYTFLKIDMIIKSVWCIYRLYSKKWIKEVYINENSK